MSPSLAQLRSTTRADRATGELVAAAGVQSIDDLRTCPVDDLLAAQAAVLADPTRALTAFAPTSHGDLLPGDILADAAADPRPLVIGTTRDEMHLFNAFDPANWALDEPGLLTAFERRFPGRADVAISEYRAMRPDHTPGQLLSAMQTDEMLRVPVRRLSRGAGGERQPDLDVLVHLAEPGVRRDPRRVPRGRHPVRVPQPRTALACRRSPVTGTTGSGSPTSALARCCGSRRTEAGLELVRPRRSHDAALRRRIRSRSSTPNRRCASCGPRRSMPSGSPQRPPAGDVQRMTTGIGSITDVPGVRVGHAQRVGRGWLTGTTVVSIPRGAVPGVDVRGGGPGTRETDALDPRNLVDLVHAVCLTGGSAFGLAAADGVMDVLAGRGLGVRVGPGAQRSGARRAGRGDLRPRPWRRLRQSSGCRLRPARPRSPRGRRRRHVARSAPAPAPSPAGCKAASARPAPDSRSVTSTASRSTGPTVLSSARSPWSTHPER